MASNRPTPQSLAAGAEITGTVSRSYVGRYHALEIRIGSTLVRCGASTSGESFLECPLNRAADGQHAEAVVVDVPTAIGRYLVVKSFRLADGTAYATTNDAILADWESSSNKMEAFLSGLLTLPFAMVAGIVLLGKTRLGAP